MSTIRNQQAEEFFTVWEKATNSFGSERMLPYLIDAINKVHPTLQQQMVALMLNLLKGIQTEYSDARNDASNVVVKGIQEWLERKGEEGKVYTDHDGHIVFPMI